jgi:hypothetical protein
MDSFAITSEILKNMSPIAASAVIAPELFKKSLRIIALSPPPESFFLI